MASHNAKTVTRLYDTLTPAERASLAIAAILRNDLAELNRLDNAAPLEHRDIPNHMHIATAIAQTALGVAIEQLQAALLFWWSLAQLQSWSDDLDDENKAMLNLAGNVAAYVFSQNAMAWKAFCENHAVDGEALIHGGPYDYLLDMCEAAFPKVAPSKDALCKAMGTDPDKAPTAERLAKQLEQAFAALLGN